MLVQADFAGIQKRAPCLAKINGQPLPLIGMVDKID